MQRTRRKLAPLLLGLAALGVPVVRAATPGQTPPPRLFGAWTVNQQLTAELAQRERGDSGAGGHGGGWGHGGEHGGGGPGGGGRPHGGGGFGERGERGGDSGHTPPANLIFTSAPDGAVVLSDAAGHERRFAPGAPAKREAESPDGAQVSASWDADGDLVVEIKPDRGPRRTETYIVDHEKKHLYVTTVVTSGFGSHTRTLAFDPVDPATLPAPGTASPDR